MNLAHVEYQLNRLLILGLALTALAFPSTGLARPRWSEQAAQAWYHQQPWIVGSNYIPASAINELEMWQADTFDPQRIDLELGWAQSAYFPWDSWDHPYLAGEPMPWFHDVFRADGQPYDAEEVSFIREILRAHAQKGRTP